MLAWGGYLVGLVTSPMWVLYIMAGFFCLLFFDLSIAVSGMATCLVAIVATTLAERLGSIAYAPLYADWPQIDGRLTDAWVISSTIWPAAFSLMTFALFAVILTRARRQAEQLAQMTEQVTHANELISRYVAAQVAERILAGDSDAIQRHERRKLTVFFSDIRGFTEIAERIEPEDLSHILNDYLSEMTRIVEEYGGTIDKFVGDAIMVFFGAPAATNDKDHALRAVRMAITMQEHMAILPERWRNHAIGEVFEVRIGINTGHASIGNFGSAGRMDYTAIGRHVNLAARLEASCEPGRILISHPTWLLVHDEIACMPKGEIRVKGVRDPVTVYEVVPPGSSRASLPPRLDGAARAPAKHRESVHPALPSDGGMRLRSARSGSTGVVHAGGTQLAQRRCRLGGVVGMEARRRRRAGRTHQRRSSPDGVIFDLPMTAVITGGARDGLYGPWDGERVDHPNHVPVACFSSARHRHALKTAPLGPIARMLQKTYASFPAEAPPVHPSPVQNVFGVEPALQ